MHKALKNLASRDIERILKAFGFELVRQSGSHRQFMGRIRGERRLVTVKANQRHFPRWILKSMIKQSGLSEAEWLQFEK